MKETKLNATTQKSYYGKAVIIDDENGVFALRSYDTIVCRYDSNTGVFTRLWGGYSRTTANHVNDFRRHFGLAPLCKKEWEKIPVEGESGERYKVEFSNGFVSWVAGVIFDNEDDAWTFAEDTISSARRYLCACVIEA